MNERCDFPTNQRTQEEPAAMLDDETAPQACERFLTSVSDYPGGYEGRGIVICAGGRRHFTNAWVAVNMLRRMGAQLPIELWHLGRHELGGVSGIPAATGRFIGWTNQEGRNNRKIESMIQA